MTPIRRGTPLKSILVDGTKVRLLAEVFGLSLREVARRMGCSHAYLLQVLDGRKHISTRFAPKLVEVLEEIARSAKLNAFAFMREAAPTLTTNPLQSPAAAAPPAESQVA